MAKQQLNEGIADLVVAYKFLKKLTTPFKDTEAFKLGIIDEDGKILKKANTLQTKEEKDAYGYFDRLVFNLKKLLEKVPGGKSRLASYAAALYLIKESANPKEHYSQEELAEGLMENLTMLEKTSTKKLNEVLKEDYYNVIYKNKKGKVEAEKSFKDKRKADAYAKKGNSVDKVGGTYTVTKVKGMMEDAPANVTGAAVAGTGDDPAHWVDKKRKIDFRFKEMKAILSRYQRGKEKREALKTKKDFKEKLGLGK